MFVFDVEVRSAVSSGIFDVEARLAISSRALNVQSRWDKHASIGMIFFWSPFPWLLTGLKLKSPRLRSHPRLCLCRRRLRLSLSSSSSSFVVAPCYVAAPKNYRPTSTCFKIILAGAFDVEARSAVSLGLLDVEGRSADSSVFLCVFAQSSPSVGIFGQRTGRWYFLQSSPSTGILTNGLDRAFWGGSA